MKPYHLGCLLVFAVIQVKIENHRQTNATTTTLNVLRLILHGMIFIYTVSRVGYGIATGVREITKKTTTKKRLVTET